MEKYAIDEGFVEYCQYKGIHDGAMIEQLKKIGYDILSMNPNAIMQKKAFMGMAPANIDQLLEMLNQPGANVEEIISNLDPNAGVGSELLAILQQQDPGVVEEVKQLMA